MRKTTIVFWLLFFFLYQHAHAVNQRFIDSLQQLLDKYTHEKIEMRNNVASLNDSNIVTLLTKFATVYHVNDGERATKYANQALALGQKIGFKRGIAKSYLVKGLIYYVKGDYLKAVEEYNRSLKIRIEINDFGGLYKCYLNIGNSYILMGNYPEAIRNYLTALKAVEQSKDTTMIASLLSNLGIVYYYQSQPDSALAYYHRSLELNTKIHDIEGIVNNYQNIGGVYYFLKKYEESISWHQKVIDSAPMVNDKSLLASAYANMGNAYFKLQNYTEALRLFNESVILNKEINSQSNLADAIIGIGKVNYGLKKYPAAKTQMLEGLNLSLQTGAKPNQSEAYEYLTKIDSAMGNFKGAFEYHKLFVAVRDSLIGKEKSEKILQERMQYEFEKKEALTAAKQAIKDALAKEEISKQKQIKIGIAVLSVLAILILLLLYFRRKEKHITEVNKLVNKTLRAQLNPHFIFNALGSIQTFVNEHPNMAENYLAKFAKLMREVLENSDLEFISLEDEFEMLKKYMDLEKLRVKQGFEYEIIIDENIDQHAVKVPPLIFQPIIENAIWHGVANSIEQGRIIINIKLTGNFLKVTIENTGNSKSTTDKNKGYAIKKKSYGLQIVKDRLAMLSKERKRKATLENKLQESGMQVIVHLPLL